MPYRSPGKTFAGRRAARSRHRQGVPFLPAWRHSCDAERGSVRTFSLRDCRVTAGKARLRQSRGVARHGTAGALQRNGYFQRRNAPSQAPFSFSPVSPMSP
jgi:hypothetical protein